jgi:hypothetical protein
MPSELRQFHLPLTEQQHTALEAYAKERGLSKAEAARKILGDCIVGFGTTPVPKRGKYERKSRDGKP